MKTILYIIALSFCIQYSSKAQFNSSYQIDEMPSPSIAKKNYCDGFKPVFYDFTRRRLYSNNKMPLNSAQFLDLCRGINDDRVQLQISRYDELTNNKKKLVAATLICGIGGYVTLMGSAIAASSPYITDRHYIGMGIGAIALLATPFLAISTSIPHQKRKEILFHDLPEAYNFYVTSQPNH